MRTQAILPGIARQVCRLDDAIFFHGLPPAPQGLQRLFQQLFHCRTAGQVRFGDGQDFLFAVAETGQGCQRFCQDARQARRGRTAQVRSPGVFTGDGTDSVPNSRTMRSAVFLPIPGILVRPLMSF